MRITDELSPEPNTAFRGWLENEIKAFNNRVSPYHLAARAPGYVRYCSVIVSSPSGKTIGGLSGRVYWGWLYIDDLIIPENMRGQGIGTQLMDRAELLGNSAGARRSLVETFSFQAPEFYKNRGYRVIGEVPDYPPGASILRLMKDL